MRPVRAALLAATLLATTPAIAATLRDGSTTLAEGSVRLSDLFDGIETDRVIGPAPEPGGRIVVEAAQLAAIARQFTVDWRSTNSGDRIVLERPGRPFPREPILDALRDALLAIGLPVNSEIETPNFTAPMVPLDDSAKPDVTQAAYDMTTGRFTALLSITARGMTPFNARLSGHVQEMIDVEVTTRRLAPGDVIYQADLQPARIRAGLARSEPVRLPEQAVGLALRHAVNAGAPLLLLDLGRPMLVQRGSPVQVQLDMPGLASPGPGVAREPAAAGERVHVLNPVSRAIMDAEVIDSQRVRVTGGSPALLPPGAAVPRPSAVRVAVR